MIWSFLEINLIDDEGNKKFYMYRNFTQENTSKFMFIITVSSNISAVR